jgi:Tfp pilus assembly protein PilV
MSHSSESGFTLVEALLSILILGISLINIAMVFSDGIVFISKMKEISIATQDAQAEMEKIRDMNFSSIASHTFTPAGLTNPTGTVTVSSAPGADSNMKSVTVKVTWTSYLGTTVKRSLVTFVTNEGIDRK